MDIVRKPDWEECLYDVIGRAMCKPFAWGSHDCALFAADCIRAMTGADFGAEYRGQYKTRLGAARQIAERGADSVAGLLDIHLGERIERAGIARGDCVVVATRNGPTAGICLGERCIFPADRGIQYLPTFAAVAAWRVG